MSPVPFQATNIPISPTATLLLEISLLGLQPQISFQVINAANSAGPTSDFLILRKLHDAGDFLPYLGGLDFETATTKCNASTPGPHELPPGESAWVDLDCGAATAVQFWATAGSGGAAVSVFGGARTSR